LASNEEEGNAYSLGLVGRRQLEGPTGRLFSQQDTDMEKLAMIQNTYDILRQANLTLEALR
jgi:hypothetical protein